MTKPQKEEWLDALFAIWKLSEDNGDEESERDFKAWYFDVKNEGRA